MIICIIQSSNFYWFCHPLNFDVYTHASHNQLFCVFFNIDLFVNIFFYQIYLIQNLFLIYEIRRFLPFGEKSISNLDITLDYAKLQCLRHNAHMKITNGKPTGRLIIYSCAMIQLCSTSIQLLWSMQMIFLPK